MQYDGSTLLKKLNNLNADITEPQATLNWVACHRFPGLPSHTLTVKVNSVYQLLHNFSLNHGLVKNMHCLVTDIGHYLMTVYLLRMN